MGVPGAGLASAGGPAPGAADDPPPQAEGVPLHLVFVDVASGSVRASRAAEVTSRYVNNILPYYDQYALSHRLWAPDSSAIALPLVVDDVDRLYVDPGRRFRDDAARGRRARLLEPVTPVRRCRSSRRLNFSAARRIYAS